MVDREIRVNDFVLTALHKANYTFKEILEFYDNISNILTEDEMELWAKEISSTTWQLPKHVTTRVSELEDWNITAKTSAQVINPDVDYEK